jgi:ubiquinone/menaquinone biosynthesis C-methylase UbiE
MDLDADRLAREREFHDDLASELRPEEMPPPTSVGPIEAAMLEAVGGVAGKRVLDLGCGIGDMTLTLLAAGAQVTAIDLSPGMVDVARRRVERFMPDAEATFVASPAEDLPFPDDSFDVVAGRLILHHLEITRAPAEIARVLAPGGSALFVENSARNPVLMFARDRVAGRYGVTRLGTADEHPLSEDDVAHIRRALPGTELLYPVFNFFTIFDRQVLRYKVPLISRLCHGLDHLVWRTMPFARKYSYRVLVRARA